MPLDHCPETDDELDAILEARTIRPSTPTTHPAATATCRYCQHPIAPAPEDSTLWIATDAPQTPEEGDDHIWRDYCPDNDTERAAPHEPEDDDTPTALCPQCGWPVLASPYVHPENTCACSVPEPTPDGPLPGDTLMTAADAEVAAGTNPVGQPWVKAGESTYLRQSDGSITVQTRGRGPVTLGKAEQAALARLLSDRP